MPGKPAAHKTKRRAGSSAAGKKSTLTRDKIMAAAREVFSRHPYHAASMRMIGRAGGFNHELIRYHFPNKAALFETILRDICEDFYQSNRSFLEGVTTLSPAEGFSLYLDRFLDRHYGNPEAVRIIVLNMVIIDEPDGIPGYRMIPELMARMRKTFRDTIPLRASDDEVERFQSGLNNLFLHLLGADYYQSSIIGLKHTDRKYREWVKDTLLWIFLPHLLRLLGQP